MTKQTMKSIAALCVCGLAGAAFAERTGPWSVEQAWAWYRDQPWIRGCNYMPASAANRVDQWQGPGSEARFAEVERELAAAEALGFNAMRLLVEWCGFGVWLADPDGFLERFERYLEILDRHHMRAIVVLGNDCSRPKRLWKLPQPGVQPCDWGYHGGRKASQHGSFPNEMGFTPVDDPELAAKFYVLCETLMTKYRSDPRILFWNVWNEPGNNRRGKASVEPLRRVFGIGWRAGVVQPLAADVWMERPDPGNMAEQVAGELSDIVSYHCYGNLDEQKERFNALRKRFGRPMINTEWLARTLHNEVFDAYPFFAQNRIGCTMWGLVAGKYQTYEPWEHMWNEIARGGGQDYDMSKWFHDLLRPSLRPYDPRETNVICRINAQMDAERKGLSVRARIAASHKIVSEDIWHGFRRMRFEFDGGVAWLVEPSASPAVGMPWVWAMPMESDAADRVGTVELLERGWHCAALEIGPGCNRGAAVGRQEAFREFLVRALGFNPQTCVMGIGPGARDAVRYAAAHSETVSRLYLDSPRLKDGEGAPSLSEEEVARVARAGIPALLLYGDQDAVAPPCENAEWLVRQYETAGKSLRVLKREGYGHRPYGVERNRIGEIVRFFVP